MILIREYFIAKPGHASQLAEVMTAASELMKTKSRVMTDLTGHFNQVVMETEAESIAEFEARMQEYGKNNELRERMKGYTDLYLTGGREIYRLL